MLIARSTAQEGEKLYFGMFTNKGMMVTAAADVTGALSVGFCIFVRRQASKMCYNCASAVDTD